MVGSSCSGTPLERYVQALFFFRLPSPFSSSVLDCLVRHRLRPDAQNEKESRRGQTVCPGSLSDACEFLRTNYSWWSLDRADLRRLHSWGLHRWRRPGGSPRRGGGTRAVQRI